jgi:hypothetical protein
MTKAKLRELLASVAAAVGDRDEDTDEGTLTVETITATARAVAPTVYQRVFDAGHSERDKKAKKELEGVQSKLDEATKELTSLKSGKSEGTEDEKTKRIAELEAKVSALETEKTTLVAAHKKELAESARALRVESLRAKLTGRDGEHLDPDYAEVVLGLEANRNRIRVNDDGSVDVLSPSGVPFAPGEGKDALDMLADEMIATAKTAKPKFVLVRGDEGSGLGGSQGRTGGSGGKAAGDQAFFEGIRKDVQDRQKASEPEGGSAATRMGLRVIGAGGAQG